MSKQLRAGLLLTLTALIWGSAFVAQSVGMDYVEPFTYLFSRNVIGGIILIPTMKFVDKFNGKENNPSAEPKDKRTLIIGGICCGIALFVASSFQQIGIKYTSVGKAGFITSLYMIIVPIFGIFLKKHVPKKVWVAVVIAIIGMYFLCMTGETGINNGDILVLLCAVGFSFHILIIDHFSPKVDGVRLSCIQFWICALISFFPMVILEKPTFSMILAAWAPILYAGALSSGAGYTLQIIAQKDIEPTIASLICSLESVFSVLFGWLILHQALSGKELFGCALVFAAVILTQIPEKSKA